ncbi:MAG TPA: hypothetical protein VK152_07405, partial [Paludibacter sp.]|nr:hypothetical protein [Paludibacter sp.]
MNKEKNTQNSIDLNLQAAGGVRACCSGFFGVFLPLVFAVLLSPTASAQKIKHPSLLYTAERVQQAKQQLKTDATAVSAWNSIKEVADANLKKNDLGKCDFLSLAYLMTDDTKYANKVRDILLKTVRGDIWSNNSEMLARKPAWNSELQLARKCGLSALAYDAIYNTLTAPERKEIAEGLYRIGVVPALGDWFLEPTRIHSLNSMGHNWWTSCVCNGALLALSLQNELPELRDAADKVYDQLPEWFAFAGDEIQNKPKSCDVNGGMYESVNYANFGISEALLYRLCWQNAHPSEKPNAIPEISNAQDFFIHVCYPRTGQLYSLNFGDSHTTITGQNTLMLLLALGSKDNNILWYLNQLEQGQTRDGFFKNSPTGFLYWPDTKPANQTPQLPNSQIFPDFGWATMRTSWEKNSTLLAVKSG